MSSPDLLVVGDCNPDVLVVGDDLTPAFGQRERLVGSMSLMIGGSAAITAVAAARLGLRVALVAAVGDDAAGELMLSLLRREGVDVGGVAVRAGQPTGMTTVLSRGADRAILTAPGAIATLTAADVPLALLGRVRHLHVSSYFLLESCLGPGLPELLSQARLRGVRTSLDTNDDPSGRWGDEQLRAVLREVDVFAPNASEALAIAGARGADAADGTDTPGLARPIRGVGRAATALAGLAWSVVVKQGPRGALVAQPGPDAARAQVSVPSLNPVDTTGAGDCFNAGLIAGLLTGLDLPRAAALGCAAGALSTQGIGGTGAHVDLATAAGLAECAVLSTRLGPGC